MVDLNNSAQETSMREMLLKMWQGKFIILAVLLLSVSVGLAHYFFSAPRYNATAIIMVKSPDKDKLIGDRVSDEQVTSIETDVALLQSYPLADHAVHMLLSNGNVNNLELFGTRNPGAKGSSGYSSAPSPVRKNTRGYAEDLQDRVEAKSIRETRLIEVSVSSRYPDEAALLANTVCAAYRQKDSDWNAAQDISVSKTIEHQIDQQKKKVEAIETSMADFMKNKEVYEPTGNVQQIQSAYSAAETEYNANRVQYDILKKQLAFIDQKLSERERSLSKNLTKDISTQLRSMRENIKTQESAYIALALEKGGDDPEVNESRKNLSNLKAQYDQITRKKIAGEIANTGNAQQYRFDMVASKMQVNVRLAELNNSANEYVRLKNNYQAKLSQLPDKQIVYARLQLDHEVANKTYAFLKEKLDEARIKVASNTGRVVILKPAFPPVSPETPNLIQNLIYAFGGGFILGALIVIGKDSFQ